MKPGSIEDVASAQAVVLWDLARDVDPPAEVVEAAGLVDFVVMGVAPTHSSLLDRVFRPGKVLRERAALRAHYSEHLDAPMRRALAAAALAASAPEQSNVTRAAS